MNDRRGVTAALGFAQLSPQTSAHRALRAWLDTWAGLGLVVVGLAVVGLERAGFRSFGDLEAGREIPAGVRLASSLPRLPGVPVRLRRCDRVLALAELLIRPARDK